MPIISDREYECDFCHRVFGFVRNEDWSEAKAIEEFNRMFPGSSLTNKEIVCDECWELVRPDKD